MADKDSGTPRNAAVRPVTKRSNGRALKRLIVTVLIVAGLGGSAFFAFQYKQVKDDAKRLSDPKAAAQQELSEITNKVGKYAVLPDETPTLATVSDPAKLKGQSFFANAKEGDKLLLYSKAKRAVLYRPSAGKIVEIAPISVTETGAEGTQAGTTPATDTNDAQ